MASSFCCRSPGGPTIITTVANVLMGVVDYGLNIEQAVTRRAFTSMVPDQIEMETVGFSPRHHRYLDTWATRLKLLTYWATPMHCRRWQDGRVC